MIDAAGGSGRSTHGSPSPHSRDRRQVAIRSGWQTVTRVAVRNLWAELRCWNRPRPPAVTRCSAPGRPAVFVSLLILIVVLFGLGFLHPLWWVAAAVLVFAATRRGRGGGGWIRGDGSDLGEYRDYENRRDRQDRWDRRYSRRHRARWRREDRRDREHRG